MFHAACLRAASESRPLLERLPPVDFPGVPSPMRLHRRPRYDTLRNEARKRGRSWGRWIYLGLVAAFFAWLFDIFLGDLVYLRAEGLVMRDRVALATQ